MNWKNRKPCEWLKTFTMVASSSDKHHFKGEPVPTSRELFERSESAESQPSEGFNCWKSSEVSQNLRGLVSKHSQSKQFRHYLKALSIVVLSFIFISCESTTKSDNVYAEFQPGIYKYSGYNENDAQFVAGKLRLHFDDDSSLTGSWNMDAVRAGEKDHPHIGQGDLVCRIENDTITCNLHPGWMDHNIILRGYYEDGEITGEWSYISFIGYTDGGKFKAKYFSGEE